MAHPPAGSRCSRGGTSATPRYAFRAMDVITGIELPDSTWADVNGPVHYREWPGPPEGPTFVCVHGLGGSHLNWAGVAPGLSRLGRVLALDLAGFGLTPPAGRGTSLGANWRLLDGFLRALRLGPVALVGNSMGGNISMIQAAHAPDTVSSLILVDAAFPRARSIRGPRSVRGQTSPRVAAVFGLYANRRVGQWFVANRARRLGPEGLVRETFRICAADPSSIDPRLVAAHVEMARHRADFDYATDAFLEAARSILQAQVYPGRYRELVRAIRTPGLVMHGAQDILIAEAAAREAVIGHPNWTLEVFPDLGHIPMMEDPARWLAIVERWLDGRDAARSAG
jgi:pimeloyl-ACP methyl ester carboxylesterase